MDKHQLREELKRQRTAMPPHAREAKSQEIARQALELIKWGHVSRVHCYQSAATEVATEAIIAFLRMRGLAVDSPQLHAHEPTPTELKAEYDVIIVPMLGFDSSLHRIGYGGGYYDRLLAAHPKAQAIGLCFQTGYTPNLPVEPHDKPVAAVVTEDRVYPSELV